MFLLLGMNGKDMYHPTTQDFTMATNLLPHWSTKSTSQEGKNQPEPL